MYSDYFLKFASKDEARQVFSTIPDHTYQPVDGDGNPIPNVPVEIGSSSGSIAIDEVGVLYNNDGVYDEEGNVITPPTQIEGYHFNYRTVYGNKPPIPLPVELESYIVTPETPQRTFL